MVLAAGAGRRFGGGKVLAELDGRPLLQHVLDALAAAGHDDPVVVLGRDAAVERPRIRWRRATIVVNPAPERGLASSVQLAWAAAIQAGADGVLIALADQPRLSPALVRALTVLPLDAARPIVAPAYAGGGGRNPVRVEATAVGLIEGLTGDRGLGPLIDDAPDLVRSLDAPGSNPDVDRPEDLASIARGHDPA